MTLSFDPCWKSLHTCSLECFHAHRIWDGMSAESLSASPVFPAESANLRSHSILRSVELAGPAGRLEALLNEGAPDAPYAALVCHPHPLAGGNFHHKVVYRAMKVFNAAVWGFGFPVLRFNFRGMGLSQGVHDGDAEAEDVLAALGWLTQTYHRPIILAGFSFGAAMSLRAASQLPASISVRALAALGTPVDALGRHYEYPFLGDCTLPKLFLSGDRDEFASARSLARIVATAPDPKQLVLIPGADHFFTGHIEQMQRALGQWLKELLA